MEVVGSVDALVVSDGLLWVCRYRDGFRSSYASWSGMV